jgi:pimeloyl-ACP methyl ester carboxylesterase
MYIQLDGQVLQYEKEGDGSPLLLLHGNGESHEIFDGLIPELTGEHTVYAIDSRGQGGSATPKDYHYADMAADVVNFIQALHLEQPILCGFSDGAIIALLVAMSHSDLLSAIVVCGANLSPKGLTGTARREIKSLYKKTSSPLVKMMLEEPQIHPSTLGQITVPTLVCAGSKDMVKPKETQLIAEHIPGATLHIFEGETHGSYVEHSNKLAPVLKDFLSTLPQ